MRGTLQGKAAPIGTRAHRQHSQGLQVLQPLEAVRPQMPDAVVMEMPVWEERRVRGGPRAEWRGLGDRRSQAGTARSPRLERLRATLCPLPIKGKSQRHGLGRAGVVSVGETPMVESKLKVNRSMFSQFLMERAQALTRKRAPPQPSIVTAAAQQGQTEAQSRDRGRGNAPGPQQRPSCEKKVLRRLQGAPELERGAVSFRGGGGREGDEGSSGAEPRGTSVGRERASPTA